MKIDEKKRMSMFKSKKPVSWYALQVNTGKGFNATDAYTTLPAKDLAKARALVGKNKARVVKFTKQPGKIATSQILKV